MAVIVASRGIPRPGRMTSTRQTVESNSEHPAPLELCLEEMRSLHGSRLRTAADPLIRDCTRPDHRSVGRVGRRAQRGVRNSGLLIAGTLVGDAVARQSLQ